MANAATPPRKRRRLRRILAMLVLGPLIALATLPALLSTSLARRGLVALANQRGFGNLGGLRSLDPLFL
jgi:ABC-type cobalamin transport system permease subunit